MRRLPRPSPSMAVAVLALFVALGGTGYAATKLAKNSVGAKQIRNGAVGNGELANNSVGTAKLRKGSVTGAKVKLSSLGAVPKAKDASTLGGQGAGAFAPAPRWAAIKGSTTGAEVLASSGNISVTRRAAGDYLVDFGTQTAGHPLEVSVNGGALRAATVVACGGTTAGPEAFDCGTGTTANMAEILLFRTSNNTTSDGRVYIRLG